jgi:hypothetical protein
MCGKKGDPQIGKRIIVHETIPGSIISVLWDLIG